MAFRFLVPVILAAAALTAAENVAFQSLDAAFQALRERKFDLAISHFRAAAGAAPQRADIQKNLGYTFLKIGETELARDAFGEAMRLDPDDDHVALEYAFLCYETKEQAAGRRIFDKIRRKGNATAEQAFSAIDKPLVEGIARWSRAVELSPDQFSAHHELARLAEQRDELALATKHYQRAWELRPTDRSLLLDLGRVWQLQQRTGEANAALLAASRGAEPRTAEAAKALLPRRYPYVYEFENALKIDPSNTALRRELAYLHLEMGEKGRAEAEFYAVIAAEPGDSLSVAQLGFLLIARGEPAAAAPLLERALTSEDEELTDRVRSALRLPKLLRKRPDVPQRGAGLEARSMAEKSLEAGYLKDALKYLRIVHEHDPLDFDVLLKLGQTSNVLHDDRSAVEWFRLARNSPNAAVADEARRAYENLRPEFVRFRTTTWLFPFYSSRWKDVFAYGQIKTELMPAWRVRPYLSVRLAGDLRRSIPGPQPGMGVQHLSENAGIFGVGVTTAMWHGMRAWAEAGSSVTYVGVTDRSRPDYRVGLSAARAWGRNFGSRGVFAESTADVVYVSRFDRDTILYAQNRGGYTLPGTGTLQFQLCLNANVTTDARRYAWANTVETGPGVRLRVTAMGGQPVVFFADTLYGRYTVADASRQMRYTDLRIGLWYAFTR